MRYDGILKSDNQFAREKRTAHWYDKYVKTPSIFQSTKYVMHWNSAFFSIHIFFSLSVFPNVNGRTTTILDTQQTEKLSWKLIHATHRAWGFSATAAPAVAMGFVFYMPKHNAKPGHFKLVFRYMINVCTRWAHSRYLISKRLQQTKQTIRDFHWYCWANLRISINVYSNVMQLSGTNIDPFCYFHHSVQEHAILPGILHECKLLWMVWNWRMANLLYFRFPHTSESNFVTSSSLIWIHKKKSAREINK